MKLLQIFSMLLLLMFFSCSKSKDAKDVGDGEDIEMVDGEEFESEGDVELVDSEEGFDEFEDEENDELAEDDGFYEDELLDDGEEVAGSYDEYEDFGLEEDTSIAGDVGGNGVEELEQAEANIATSDTAFESNDGAPLADMGGSDFPVQGTMPAPAYDTPSPGVAISDAPMGGGIENYSVKSNETLMIIAFKLYGDYTRWKEIQRLNSEQLAGSTVISPGMNLKYNSQGAGFVWNPEGNPYLIQRGDTLGRISGKVYGTQSKWKNIWDNNRALIRDPNRIFAGFTIYYTGEKARDIASQQVEVMNQETSGAAAPVDLAPTEGFEEEFNDFPEDL
jgi:hypothetical protein